jgi:putative phosphoribosyl transferase
MYKTELQSGLKKQIIIPFGEVKLEGLLQIPEESNSIVIFAHGSGSSHLSPRNMYVAECLHESKLGTLLIDLLSQQEDEFYQSRFNIKLLTERLIKISNWVLEQPELRDLKIGYFGASTGAASALIAAAKMGNLIKAIVCRGGRVDLADSYLTSIKSPVLLIVGGKDSELITLNELAYEKIKAPKRLDIIPNATHLFEEPTALEEVSELSAEWFVKHLS